MPMTIADEQALRKSESEAWRYMLPFFLLVVVFLLALYRFLGLAESTAPMPLVCPENSVRYLIKAGDSCWAIGNDRGATVADLTRLNQGIDCSLLKAGRDICVPVGK
ncbi:carbohydrate-binding module family 50 protein [Hyaloscypha hepaticicola]|uniref:Carbohydrate-binding module family 50 protein n=1 Tax=Hyaloscypha hepaticicola TaxID=2082293 RepID=A0A2J6Q361_9HELO|nr:carbohydrate-binding module family 50 protein [Hyaloscypha hepaticicola]